MEQRLQPKKRYLSASYLTSGAVFYGALLFLIARIFTLLSLFSDAYTRNKLNQAPPENFTFFGIVGSLLIIGIIGFAFYLLLLNRQKRLKMKKGNFYLLLNTLFAVWGVVNAITFLVEMILFFEFVYLLDFITLFSALVVPSVLYQLSDRKQDIPPDNLLFATAIGSVGLSVIAALIVALVLRKSYTSFQLVRELMFRAGIILFGVAGLMRAIKLRAELPELVAAMPKSAPPPPKEVKVKPVPKKKADPLGRIECPDCGKRLPAGTKACPRCGFDLDTPSLFDDEDEDFEEGTPEEPPQDEPAAEPEYDDFTPPEPVAPVREELPKDICPRCNKKKPPFLSTCPHCGYYPGDPIERAEIEAEQKRQAEEDAAPAYQPPQPKQEPKCEKCGRAIPGGLATCPYCGYHPDDDRMPPPPPADEVESLFDEEEEEYIFCPRCDNEVIAGTEICPHCGFPFQAKRETGRIQRPTQRLPRVPDPRHLNEKNSIRCPECGRRYSAARDRCPYCGYGLYDN
jgi:ribosomal protein L37E